MRPILSIDDLSENGARAVDGLTSGSPVYVERESEVVGVLVSPDDYEVLRRARASQLIEAMSALRQEIFSRTTPEEREELMREIDRHNL